MISLLSHTCFVSSIQLYFYYAAPILSFIMFLGTLIYLCVTIRRFHLVRKSKRIIQKEHKAEVNLEFDDVSGPDNNP